MGDNVPIWLLIVCRIRNTLTSEHVAYLCGDLRATLTIPQERMKFSGYGEGGNIRHSKVGVGAFPIQGWSNVCPPGISGFRLQRNQHIRHVSDVNGPVRASNQQ